MNKALKVFEDWWESRDRNFDAKNLCIQAFHLGECVEADKNEYTPITTLLRMNRKANQKGKTMDKKLLKAAGELTTKKLKPMKDALTKNHKPEFIVINCKYLNELPKGTINTFYTILGYISSHNKYYVCNQDEPYAQRVLDTILNGEAEKAE